MSKCINHGRIRSLIGPGVGHQCRSRVRCLRCFLSAASHDEIVGCLSHPLLLLGVSYVGTSNKKKLLDLISEYFIITRHAMRNFPICSIRHKLQLV